MEKILEKLFDKFTGQDKMVVTKTIPMKKDWVTRYKALDKVGQEAAKASAKHENYHKAFWAFIHDQTGLYGESLRYNEETNEIEVLTDKSDLKKPIKSPIQTI